MKKPLSVMWLGLRGFPGVQGGVESHAQHLCPLLAQLDCEVTAIVRARYQPRADARRWQQSDLAWQGVRFAPLWSPRASGLEAIVHTFLGVLYAAARRPDILHIHGIGPALMAPLARLLGLRVVVTHHGPDYERQKWGRFARTVLRLGERLGMRCAHARIVISRPIHDAVRAQHARASTIIPNGVVPPEDDIATDAPRRFGLEPLRYVLLVGRLVPEKRHHDLIAAFLKAALPGWKLAIVGGADHPDAYSASVLNAAHAHEDVVCTGVLTGDALMQMYAHAAVFVLPSSHEGLPIVMLEAISHGIPVIASDIAANREVQCEAVRHYPLGDVEALAQCLRDARAGCSDAQRAAAKNLIRTRYHWPDLARRTVAVYAHARFGERAAALASSIDTLQASSQAGERQS